MNVWVRDCVGGVILLYYRVALHNIYIYIRVLCLAAPRGAPPFCCFSSFLSAVRSAVRLSSLSSLSVVTFHFAERFVLLSHFYVRSKEGIDVRLCGITMNSLFDNVHRLFVLFNSMSRPERCTQCVCSAFSRMIAWLLIFLMFRCSVCRSCRKRREFRNG